MDYLLLFKRADFFFQFIFKFLFGPNTSVSAELHTLGIEIEVESHLYRLYSLRENRVSTDKRIDSNNWQYNENYPDI